MMCSLPRIRFWLAALLFLHFFGSASALDLYCGKESCYDELGLPQDASKAEIKKAYFELARKFHPDRNSSDEAAKMFRRIATAYETLFDDQSRAEYDDFLLHPERYYSNVYTYYRRQVVGPKENVWIVLIVFFSVATIVDFVYWRARYFKLREWLRNHPGVQRKVLELRKFRESESEPSEYDSKSASKSSLRPRKKKQGTSSSKGKFNPSEITDEELDQVAKVSSSESTLPGFLDLFIFRVLKMPWHISHWIYWQLRWFILFGILGHSFGPDERIYLTRVKLELSMSRWELLDPEERVSLVEKELWIPENYKEFISDQRRAYFSARKNKF